MSQPEFEPPLAGTLPKSLLDSYSIDLLLQLQGAGGEVDPAVLQSMVEDMREREEELNRKYRCINKIFNTK
jgi:hypothetical protein